MLTLFRNGEFARILYYRPMYVEALTVQLTVIVRRLIATPILSEIVLCRGRFLCFRSVEVLRNSQQLSSDILLPPPKLFYVIFIHSRFLLVVYRVNYRQALALLSPPLLVGPTCKCTQKNVVAIIKCLVIIHLSIITQWIQEGIELRYRSPIYL